MIGPIVDSGSLAIGGVLGALLGTYMPKRVKETLPLIFGVITISLGVSLVGQAEHFPVVVIALIVGAFIGELCYAEKGLEIVIKKIMPNSGDNLLPQNHIMQFVTLIAAFCFGSMGIFGAVNEGISGDPSVLIVKAALDFFSGLIFGSVLGVRVALIAIPQFIILIALYFSATLVMSYISPAMFSNFSSCGGVIFLATGLRMSDIKVLPVINMLPALLIVFPLTFLWVKFVVPMTM